MQNPVSMNHTSHSSVDFLELLRRYSRILWKKKIWILLITVLVMFSWIIFYSFFLEKIVKYTTNTVIQFDDPRSSQRFSPVTDFDFMSGLSKVAILKSNLVLGKVVDSLSLNLIIETPGIERYRLFKAIQVDSNAEYGYYLLGVSRKNFRISYSNKSKKISNKILLSSEYDKNSEYHLNENGLHLTINGSIFEEFPEVSVRYLPKRVAVEILKNDLESSLDRTQILLTISYADKDPNFSAVVTNTIAQIFINQLLEQKRFQTSSVIRSLEEQLRVSKKELDNSENELRIFREQNPFVFLAQDGQNMVSEMADYESNIYNANHEIADLNSLIQKTNQSMEFDAKIYVYRELLAALDAQDVPGAAPYAQQLEQYLSSLEALRIENYSPDHPQILKLKNQIIDLKTEVDKIASQHLKTLQNNLNRSEQALNNFQTNLRRLPRNQLRLAELERNRQIKDDIVSSITTRYNEAKVTDAAIIPDAFIIDKAQPPLIYGSMFGRLQIYGTGLLLGLLTGIGLFIILDLLNKTLRTTKEVESLLKIPVLATIPVIIDNKEIPQQFDTQKKLESKLIVSDYAPHIAGEAFRLLRTKLIMRNENKNRTFIVASLNPNEGKSLVSSNLAITFAQQKIPTILIDCDLRRGVLHHTFMSEKKPGITDILIGSNPITFESIANIIQKTHIPNLFILSNGAQIPNPSELLGGSRMRKLYEILNENFGAVVFDTPPIDIIPDAIVLNSFVHGLILVIRYGKTSTNRMVSKISEFANLRNDLIGIVINASEDFHENEYYKYSYYNY